MIRGRRGNPLNPLRIETARLEVVPTNSRWIAQVWFMEPRREGWAVRTPWFVFVIVRRAVAA